MISNPINLVKLGSNVLTLSSANTYSGNTTIMGGTLQAGINNALPSGSSKGNLSLDNGGILDLDGHTVNVNGLDNVPNVYSYGVIEDSASGGNLIVGNAGSGGSYWGPS